MLTKNVSIELKPEHILTVAVNPGWVKTDMGGQEAPNSVDKSVNGLIDVITKFDEKNNGLFYAWNGDAVKWQIQKYMIMDITSKRMK